MIKKLIGIIVIIFIINSAGVLLIRGGTTGIAAVQESTEDLDASIKEAVGNVDNVPLAQSKVDELRTLFKRILAEEAASVEAFDNSNSDCKSIMAMAIIDAEFKNIRKLLLMNYLLCKRILHVHPNAINHYLTMNFAMLERSIFEIKLTTGIIEGQLEYVKDREAIELCKRMLALEGGIIEHLFSFYEVFRTE